MLSVVVGEDMRDAHVEAETLRVAEDGHDVLVGVDLSGGVAGGEGINQRAGGQRAGCQRAAGRHAAS